MHISYLLRVTGKQLRAHLGAYLAILLSLTICSAALLMLTETLVYTRGFFEQLEKSRRTYQMNWDIPAAAGSQALARELLLGDRFDVQELTTCYAKPADGRLILNLWDPDCKMLRHGPDIGDGRDFTREELETGADVIVLPAIQTALGGVYAVGDSIPIGGRDYQVVGLNRAMTAWVPVKNALNRDDLSLEMDPVIFASPLSREQEAEFLTLARAAGAAPVRAEAGELGETAGEMVQYLVLILLIMYCAFSIIAGLFRYLTESRAYEFRIYRVLGIQSAALAGVYYAPVLLTAAVSFGLGVLLYRLTEPVQAIFSLGTSLPWEFTGALLLIMTGMLCLTTGFGFLRLVKSPVAETR